MSIVTQYILVKGQADAGMNHLLQELNLSDYVAEREVELYQANKPKTLFVGHYKDVLIIAHPDLPFAFFSKEQTEVEKKFIRLFHKSEIAVLYVNEQVGGFGYALIQNGSRVRMKDGADGSIFNDYGSLLPEELEIQKQIQNGEIIPEDELDELREDMPEEEVRKYIEFQAWGYAPELIAKRYFDGRTMNNMLGSDTKVTLFTKH